MDTNASDKILHFNTELIYEKNKYTWRTSNKAQSEKMHQEIPLTLDLGLLLLQ